MCKPHRFKPINAAPKAKACACGALKWWNGKRWETAAYKPGAGMRMDFEV